MFKDKHFEVKVKKDQPEGAQQVSYIHPPVEEITDAMTEVISSIVGGFMVYKAFSTVLRMAEHVVVTKVK